MTQLTVAKETPKAGVSLAQINRWFSSAVPTPSERNIHTQIGVHFEEVCEMLEALQESGASHNAQEKIGFAADVFRFLQAQFKAFDEGVDLDLEAIDRTAVLDALCDQIVTAVGTAHMLGLDIEGGLKEVANSNDSKFGDDGKPIFNDQMKIMKGPNYFKPDLTKYA